MGTRTGTYVTGTVTGTTGSGITMLDDILVTAGGWTKTYSATNKGVWTAPGGNGFCIRAVDDGSLVAGAREMIVRGGESATDVDTLVDAFPSTALVTDANMVWRKSDTLDTTARTYWAVVDSSFVAITVQFGTANRDLYLFGDVEPIWPGDTYATLITYRSTANNSNGGLAITPFPTTFVSTSTSAMWFARSADGLTKIERGAYLSVIGSGTFGNTNDGSAEYPQPYTTKLHWSAIRVRGNGNTGTGTTGIAGAMIRGVVPFVFEPIMGTTNSGIAPLDTFTDTAYDASSQFIIFTGGQAMNANGQRWILQTAGTWNGGV